MATITIADLTSGEIDGSGVFDKLMEAMQIRLQNEFDKTRIRGADYSKVYLGAMESVISQSIQFLLGQQTADKQADLITQQIANELLNNTLIQCQIDKCQAEILLITANTSNTTAEGLNIPKQGLQIDSQTSLVSAQELKLAGVDTAQVTAQTVNTTAQTALVDAQELKTDQETLLVTQNTANALLTANVIPKQGAKLDSEKALLDQKKFTEDAQTLDTVNALAVVGVIGKQKDLFQAQIDGFSRNAEQKAAKIIADTWAVQRSTDPTAVVPPTGIADGDITAIMQKMLLGVGIP